MRPLRKASTRLGQQCFRPPIRLELDHPERWQPISLARAQFDLVIGPLERGLRITVLWVEALQ